MELSNGKCGCAIVMPSKNNIFGNWMEKKKCGDYHPFHKKTKFDCYPMPTTYGLFDLQENP